MSDPGVLLPAEIRSVSGTWTFTVRPPAGGVGSKLDELRDLIASVHALFLGGES